MIVIKPTEADVRRLAEMAVDPADLADDGTDYVGRTIHKPWGFEYQVHICKFCALWRLVIKVGGETSLHCHPGKTTMLMVEDGGVVVQTLTEAFPLSPGECIMIENGVFHKTVSRYFVSTVIELETPPNKRDLVRAEDRYGRRGLPYEASTADAAG